MKKDWPCEKHKNRHEQIYQCDVCDEEIEKRNRITQLAEKLFAQLRLALHYQHTLTDEQTRGFVIMCYRQAEKFEEFDYWDEGVSNESD